jgi:hypothetical protein
VFLGLGGIIELEDIAVRNEFFGEPDRHSLVLSLDEERTSGEMIPLGTQTHTIAKFPVVVGPGLGPDGRPLVRAAWATTPIQAGSRIQACVQVIRHLEDRDLAVSGVECRELEPLF